VTNQHGVSPEEVQRSTVGILTRGWHAWRELDSADDDGGAPEEQQRFEDDIAALMSSWVYSLDVAIADVPPGCEDVVQRAVRTATDAQARVVDRLVTAIIGAAAMVTVELGSAWAGADPEADVEGVLQRLALNLLDPDSEAPAP
jgi:hypothetical protein